MTDTFSESSSSDEAELERYGQLMTEAMSSGDWQRVKSYCNEALIIAQRLGDVTSEASILTNLGGISFDDGDEKSAVEMLVAAIDRVQQASPDDSESKSLEGQIWFRLGLVAGECDYPVGGAKLIAITHFLDPSVQQSPPPEWVKDAYTTDRGQSVLKDVIQNWPDNHS